MNERPNKRMHTNRRPAFQFRCSKFLGRWIGCQRPFPAAVGDPDRSAVEKPSVRAIKAPFGAIRPILA